MVLALKGGGLTNEAIASQLRPGGINIDTLVKYFPHELENGKARIDGICVSGLVQAMQRGESWALCFYAKTRMGWRETNRHELVGDNGGAIRTHDSGLESLAARIDSIAAGLGTRTVLSQSQ